MLMLSLFWCMLFGKCLCNSGVGLLKTLLCRRLLDTTGSSCPWSHSSHFCQHQICTKPSQPGEVTAPRCPTHSEEPFAVYLGRESQYFCLFVYGCVCSLCSSGWFPTPFHVWEVLIEHETGKGVYECACNDAQEELEGESVRGYDPNMLCLCMWLPKNK